MKETEKINTPSKPLKQESPESQEQNPKIIRPINENSQNSSKNSPKNTLSKNISHRHNPPKNRHIPAHFLNSINITVYLSKVISPLSNFQTSRLKKLNELFKKKIFEIMNTENVFTKTRIFNNCFVNQIKNKDIEKTFEKS